MLLNATQLQAAGAALPPLDLMLAHGECLCLSGPSGIGKTRFLRLIAQLDSGAGQLQLNDRNADDYPPTEWRRQVMLLPAQPLWWLPTAAEHMAGNMQTEAEALNLPPDALTRPVADASSGEAQRLVLLRALSRKPKVLLLDEPTAQLDADNARRLEDFLLSPAQRPALLWISHDPAQISRIADRHLRLDHNGLTPA